MIPAPKNIAAIPPGAPAWITVELIEETIRVWQPYYADTLSVSEALEILKGAERILQMLAQS
jgi:hypothetical protein